MASLGEFEAAVREADPDREADTFTLCGETFTVADEIGIVPLGMFAKAATSGLDTAEMDGLAALVDMASQCVVEEDVERFLSVASKKRINAELLLKIVQAVIEAQSGRPTQRPSDSSDGSSTTGASSKALSSYDAWAQTPLGRREIEQAPEEYREKLRAVV
jgi:hypothetical protein